MKKNKTRLKPTLKNRTKKNHKNWKEQLTKKEEAFRPKKLIEENEGRWEDSNLQP